MTLAARLLWGIKLHEKIFENVLQVMHFDKSWYKKYDRLHIEIMILWLHACYMWVGGGGGHAPTRKF